MKSDWKYIFYLTLAFGLFLVVKLSGPKEYDWTPTYAAEDKNPFGSYVVRALLPSLFQGKKITVSNRTVYELKDSLHDKENILILAHSIILPKEDTDVLLTHVEKGATVFIAAQSFSGKLADTLHLSTTDYLFEKGMTEQRSDTSVLKFVNKNLVTKHDYVFKRDNVHNYFGRFDSTRTSIITENDFQQAVTIRTRWGKGNFILNCTPLAFTNIYTLKGNNNEFVSKSFSYLPAEDVHWSEYYSIGRREVSTPLRFILTHEPLAWAYYLSVVSLLLFMIFEAKRKQRSIPVIPRLENTSLEFVGTIGNLYFQREDHKNISEKKILFFFDQVRTRYNVNPTTPGETFILALAKKSGHPEAEVHQLFQRIESIRKQLEITPAELIELNTSLEKFMTTKS